MPPHCPGGGPQPPPSPLPGSLCTLWGAFSLLSLPLLPPSPDRPMLPPTPIGLLWSPPRSARTVQDKVLQDTDGSPVGTAGCRTSGKPLALSGCQLRIGITSEMLRVGSQALTRNPLTRYRDEVCNFSSYVFILICIRYNRTCMPYP